MKQKYKQKLILTIKQLRDFRDSITEYGAIGVDKIHQVRFRDGNSSSVSTNKMADTKIGISQQTLVSNGNNKSKRVTQYMAALTATLGGFIMGTILGWTSPAGDQLINGAYNFPVTKSDLSWIGSSMALGAIFGSPVCGSLVDILGRKNTMIALAVPCLVGWGLIIWAESLLMCCAGRLLTGFGGGSFAVVVPMYTAEIGEKEIRGTLGTYFQLQCTAGILFVYAVGSWAPVFQLTIICATLPIIYAGLMLLMPESPQFHLKKDKLKKAKESLRWFRGVEYDIESEITDLQNALEKERGDKISVMQAFSTPAAKRGLLIGLGVMFIQQFGGINAVVFYTVNIFKDAGSTLDPNLATIIVGTIMMVTTWIATMIVDRLGRRILLLMSSFVMALSTSTLGYYFYLKSNGSDVSTIGWLPLASLCIFIIVFSLGFGPIPWMLVGEIFPSQIKGIAVSIACLFNWFSALVVTKFFGDIQRILGAYTAFWLFSGVALVGTLFTYVLVPETKGKTLDEIQMELGGNGSSDENVMVVIETKDGKY